MYKYSFCEYKFVDTYSTKSKSWIIAYLKPFRFISIKWKSTHFSFMSAFNFIFLNFFQNCTNIYLHLYLRLKYSSVPSWYNINSSLMYAKA